MHIPYPIYPETGVKSQGRSFHHGRFVQNLRAAAARAKGVVVLEATVKDLVKDVPSGKVLGVTCRRKGDKEDEHVSPTLVYKSTNDEKLLRGPIFVVLCLAHYRRRWVRLKLPETPSKEENRNNVHVCCAGTSRCGYAEPIPRTCRAREQPPHFIIPN